MKFVVIIIPLMLGFWFVSPYLRQFQASFGTYTELLGIDNPIQKNNNQQATTTSSDDTYKQLEDLMNSEQIQQLLKQQAK